jgi:two-component system, NtrC family, sensor kinase
MSEARARVGERGRLLVVEDKAPSRETLCRYVAQLGHEVLAAENGRTALDLLRQQGPFDLVLLDVLMPEMDGLDVLEQIGADEQLRETPVIMVSGLGEIETVVRCIEHGAEDYLYKPFDPVLLRARINACLEKKRLRDAARRRAEELERALEQLKAAQDRLVVQEKMASLGVLTAGIAHEIRNPLTFVTGFAQVAQERVDELRRLLESSGRAGGEVPELLADLAQGVTMIRTHGERANSIISGMLLHARAQAGERTRTDLNALVAEHVNLAYHGMRSQNPTINAVIQTQLDRSLAPIVVVPQELGRVVLNLTQNACYAAAQRAKQEGPEFTPRVIVSTQDAGSRVEVRFRDNGNGVPTALREKIFTPFFTTKPAGAGTGLGLSISYDIVVRLHGGHLRVESEEGRFAEFIVTLPKDAPAGERGA